MAYDIIVGRNKSDKEEFDDWANSLDLIGDISNKSGFELDPFESEIDKERHTMHKRAT